MDQILNDEKVISIIKNECWEELKDLGFTLSPMTEIDKWGMFYKLNNISSKYEYEMLEKRGYEYIEKDFQDDTCSFYQNAKFKFFSTCNGYLQITLRQEV